MSDLDARIRWWITEGSDCEDPATGWDKATAALLAVLDLHTPDSWGDDERPHCTECSGNAGVRIWAPCDTVRTIAEKLGVEVSDAS